MLSCRTLVATALAAAVALGAARASAESGITAEMKKQMRDPADPVVRMTTTLGDITIELYKKDAPKSVDNFLAYVKKGHYKDTVFHRVIGNFMIQGGGYDKDLKEKPTMPPIVNEAKLSNERGTIAMARTSDPNSATSQFFINVKDNPSLDKGKMDPSGYAVFGKVIGGMDTVDKIKAVKTGPKGMHENVPLVPVIIQAAAVVQ